MIKNTEWMPRVIVERTCGVYTDCNMSAESCQVCDVVNGD